MTGLSREVSQAVSFAVVTTNCEKSADAIVGGETDNEKNQKRLSLVTAGVVFSIIVGLMAPSQAQAKSAYTNSVG